MLNRVYCFGKKKLYHLFSCNILCLQFRNWIIIKKIWMWVIITQSAPYKTLKQTFFKFDYIFQLEANLCWFSQLVEIRWVWTDVVHMKYSQIGLYETVNVNVILNSYEILHYAKFKSFIATLLLFNCNDDVN